MGSLQDNWDVGLVLPPGWGWGREVRLEGEDRQQTRMSVTVSQMLSGVYTVRDPGMQSRSESLEEAGEALQRWPPSEEVTWA